MKQQNVTISLPEDLVRAARHLAVDKGVSLSKFVANLLAEKIEAEKAEKERRYQIAKEQDRQLRERGLPLGTGGKITWTRDELHER